jgi:hypothetical protein
MTEDGVVQTYRGRSAMPGVENDPPRMGRREVEGHVAYREVAVVEGGDLASRQRVDRGIRFGPT